MYSDVALAVPSPAPPPPITPGQLTSTTRYVVSNHGNSYVLRESNSDTDGGVVDYKLAPGGWRSQSDVDTADLILQAGTGAQPHHTCRTAALDAIGAIEAWQETSAAGKPEPFYAYVPFQKASAGLDDHPDVWIPHVKTLTGVDLSTVSDDAATATTQLKAMCEALPGGVFVPADALQTAATAFNSATILAATTPLNGQIAALKTLAGQLEAQKAAAQQATVGAGAAAAAAQAEVARLKTKLRLEPVGNGSTARAATGRQSVKVLGPSGMRVTVRLRLTREAAKAAGWKSFVLGAETVTIGQDSTAAARFTLRGRPLAALQKAKSSGVYFAARSGDRWTSTRNQSR